jgi:[ribosomal protein S5]-alanine N-acetyltransferase
LLRPSQSLKRSSSLAPAVPVRVEAPAPAGAMVRTGSMVLRPLEAADRENFLMAVRLSRESVQPHLPLYKGEETDEAMFARHLELSAPAAAPMFRSARYLRLVGVLPGGEIVGGFNLNAITRNLEWTADINWWVATGHVGRGLATQGVTALTRFALADIPGGLGLHKVCAWISRENVASTRVALKAGFQKAGEENSYLSTGGNWVLHDLYVRSVADPV